MSAFTAPAPKDPSDEELNYAIDWESYFAGDLAGSIESSTWAVHGPDDSLVVVANTISGMTTTVYVDGGTANRTYTLENTVTVNGSQRQRSIDIHVENL